MKVLLISPPIMDYVGGRLQPVGVDAIRECPPLGMYSLTSMLRAEGHDVVLADLVLEGTRELGRFVEHVDGCDLIGIGATSMAWPTAVDVIGQIRRRRDDVPIVLGGIHPTLFDSYLLGKYPAQFVVRGEGELALVALCEALERDRGVERVPNLSWLDRRGKLVRNTIAQKVVPGELARFPLPDYSSLPDGAYRCLAIESSRGCSFDCVFCSTPYRRSWRGIPAEEFVDRLEAIMPYAARTSHERIHIIDDEFSMDPRRATSIAKAIRRRRLKPELLFDSRAHDLLFDGFVENIAEFTAAGLVGAECGYDEGLELVGKGSTCATLEAAGRMLQSYGIADRFDFSFILGFPWEGKVEVERTVRFATHLFAEYGVHVVLQWYRQIPGSRIWQDARREQLLNESMYDEYGFFRNLHLFGTSCRLTPREVWEVGDMLDQLTWVAGLGGRRRPSIEHHFPLPIRDNFPRSVLEQDVGLPNLRAIARPQGVEPEKLQGAKT